MVAKKPVAVVRFGAEIDQRNAEKYPIVIESDLSDIVIYLQISVRPEQSLDSAREDICDQAICALLRGIAQLTYERGRNPRQ